MKNSSYEQVVGAGHQLSDRGPYFVHSVHGGNNTLLSVDRTSEVIASSKQEALAAPLLVALKQLRGAVQSITRTSSGKERQRTLEDTEAKLAALEQVSITRDTPSTKLVGAIQIMRGLIAQLAGNDPSSIIKVEDDRWYKALVAVNRAVLEEERTY